MNVGLIYMWLSKYNSPAVLQYISQYTVCLFGKMVKTYYYHAPVASVTAVSSIYLTIC